MHRTAERLPKRGFGINQYLRGTQPRYLTSVVFPEDGHFARIVWCHPGWIWTALGPQEMVCKAQSESTVWSRVCRERLWFLDDIHRYTRNARHSKAIPAKKARVPIKVGGFMGRRIRGISAGIWLVRLSM